MTGCRIWFVILLLGLTPGGHSLATATGVVTNGPKLVCVEPSFDFGRQPGTNQIEHIFVLLNDGNAPLTITKVWAGCGCTSARLAQDEIPPGGKVELKVHFTLLGRSGRQVKSVYVHSNDLGHPAFRLELTGEIVPVPDTTVGVSDLVSVAIHDGKPQVLPGRVDFGRVKADAVSEAEIVLMGVLSNDAVAVQGVETGTTGLVARVEVTNGVCRVMLRLLPRTDLGPGSATVLVRTSHPILKAVRVPVTWVADGDLYATPGEITVVARPGATNGVVRHVAIRSRSGKPVRVEVVTSDDPGVKAETTPSPDGGSVLVRVSGIPPSGNRTLLVRGADGTSLAVPIVARVKEERP